MANIMAKNEETKQLKLKQDDEDHEPPDIDPPPLKKIGTANPHISVNQLYK